MGCLFHYLLFQMYNSNSTDSAYVRIATPLSVTDLQAFCTDIERLYRINPQLVFKEWRILAPMHYYLHAQNLSNEQNITIELYQEEREDGCLITYHQGIKSSTAIKIEPNITGSALMLTDDYSGLPEAERKQRLLEVDHSLEAWGKALYRYLYTWKRWQWFPPFRWYMRYVWQPMTPSARRIAYMLIVITLFEFIAFLVLVSIW